MKAITLVARSKHVHARVEKIHLRRGELAIFLFPFSHLAAAAVAASVKIFEAASFVVRCLVAATPQTSHCIRCVLI